MTPLFHFVSYNIDRPKFRSFRSYSWNLAQYLGFQPIGARAVSFSRSLQLSGYQDILKLHFTKTTIYEILCININYNTRDLAVHWS